jgi:hypothetical protein
MCFCFASIGDSVCYFFSLFPLNISLGNSLNKITFTYKKNDLLGRCCVWLVCYSFEG